MGKARYIARYFCSLNDPDATDTWFLIDRRTGVPVFKDGSLRLYSRQEVKALLAQPDAVTGPAVSDIAAMQDSDRYLASESIKRETGEDECEFAEEGMEETAEKYREGGDIYMPSK